MDLWRSAEVFRNAQNLDFGTNSKSQRSGGLNLHDAVFVAMEGVAAGAMLVMISETMLPEAVEEGGPAVGLMTVLGFLAAIFVNSLSGH